MHKNRLPILMMTGLLALVTACAEAPTQVFDAARARVDAVAEEGQVFAPQDYAAAREALGRLNAEVQAQADRFAMTRSFDRATELAAEVETAADEVERAVDAEKSRLRTETDSLVADAEGALEEARPAIAELDEADAEALRQDVADVESALEEVESALQGEQYADAHSSAQSAVTQARGINNSLAAMATAGDEVSEDDVMRAVRGGFDLPRRAYLGGQALQAGPYRVRLTDESASTVQGEPNSTRWLEFLHEEDGSTAGRGLATVIPDGEIGNVTDGWVPRNQVRVDDLLSGEYVRVWLNRDGAHYLVHMPTSAP